MDRKTAAALVAMSLVAPLSASARCPPRTTPTLIHATAKVPPTVVDFSEPQKAERVEEVPVHSDLEVRIVANGAPPEMANGLAGWVNKVAEAIEKGWMEDYRSRGLAVSVSADVKFDQPGVETQLQRAGFVMRKREVVDTDRGRVLADIWVRENVTRRRTSRPVDAGSLDAQLQVSGLACIDEAAGTLRLEPRVRHRMRNNIAPNAGLAPDVIRIRKGLFENKVRGEVQHVQAQLDRHLFRFSGEERQRLRSRSGQSFRIAVPFEAFGRRHPLEVEVTPLLQPVMDGPLGD